MPRRLLLTLTLILVASAQGAAWGCETDRDCKGARICRDGQCTDPPAAAPASAPVVAAPADAPREEATVPATPRNAPATYVVHEPPPPGPLTGPARQPSDWYHLLETANGARITGLVFDFLGDISYVVGGAMAAQVPLGVSSSVMSAGSFLLLVGSIIGTSGYTARHSALVDGGYAVSGGPKAAAWVMTLLTLASMGGSVATGFLAVTSDDGFGLAIASLCLSLAAGIFEVVNWQAIRGGSWERAMQSAPHQGGGQRTSLELAPVIAAVRAPAGAGMTPVFGMAGRY